jgi:hydroxymethylpyrimidine pyrophosphatase-like HAD family hydrolase
MGTSPPDVKAIARYVTTTPEEGGVAQVIERFVLGSEPVPTRALG